MIKTNIILDGHKLAWHADRVNAWLRGERIAPITIDCALTRKCTYRCAYCYGKLQENSCKEINREVIYRFLGDAADIGVKAISFVSDGESTCSPHLYAAIRRGKFNGLDMALGTNGYLLEEKELEKMLNDLTYLRFNISAADRDRYSEIHGCGERCYDRVIDIIKKCVSIKNRNKLDVTIGMQMVLMPQFSDQIIPLARLGKDLGVDYLVIKHCSDDECGSLGVDYGKYQALSEMLEYAESLSSDNYIVRAKWSKLMSLGKRGYSKCYGPPFILQISGSGLVAPCGMLFGDKYSRYHIGNIVDQSFQSIWRSDKYWDIMEELSSGNFDAHTMCGSLCLQHMTNEYLNGIKNGKEATLSNSGNQPKHVNFI